jgi:co-chaperonin GroES (HSP10)
MIIPVNNHLLITPLEHKTFLPTEKSSYDEIGIIEEVGFTTAIPVKKGDKVYFDSWLAAKLPKGSGDEYFWLVKWDDVRAIEYANEIPELSVPEGDTPPVQTT